MTQPQPPDEGIPPEAWAAGALAAMEAAIFALMMAIYTNWLAAVVKAVLSAFYQFGSPPDPAGVWTTTPLWERQMQRLLRDVEQIARAGWIAASDQLGVDIPFDPTDPIVADQLQRTRNFMVRTPDEVYRMIIAELGKSVAAGETPLQQAARVRQVLDVEGVENWPHRAQTVAVTEVHRAWNFGALALSLRVNQDRFPLRKKWLSRDDTATRPAHRTADGQTVPVSQPFIVGGEPLMAPGDPNGSAWNVINCRCKPLFLKGVR